MLEHEGQAAGKHELRPQSTHREAVEGHAPMCNSDSTIDCYYLEYHMDPINEYHRFALHCVYIL